MSEEKVQLPLFEDNTILPTGKHHISYSELFDWMECSYRHKLKHIQKIDADGPSIHTAFGNVLHTALEQYTLTGKMPSFEECVLDFQKRIGELLFTEKAVTVEEAREFINSIRPILEQAPEILDENFPNWKIVSAEEMLFEPIKGQTNKYFKGYIDLVIKVPKPKKVKGTRLSQMRVESDSKQSLYWLIDWKGQRLSAPILTPNGWTTMGQLKIGQEIVSSDGNSCYVTGIFPLGEREVYRVYFENKSFTDVTDDHLWKVYDENGNSKVLPTKTLITEKSFCYIPTISSPVKFTKKVDIPIEPYAFALLLCADNKFQVGDISSCEKRSLKSLGLYDTPKHKKFIPECYLYASPNQRLLLLQGILDQLGTCKNEFIEAKVDSKQLAKDIKHVVGSLGGVASIKKESTINGKKKASYAVEIKLPSSITPFKMASKLRVYKKLPPKKELHNRIAKIKKVGVDQMQCIAVSAKDSLYVTDDFVLTHNTTGWGWAAKQKRSFEKQMQLVLYKHFWCKKNNIDIKDVRCAWAFLKRTPRKDGIRTELLPVSAGPKTIDRALTTLNTAINQIQSGRYMKNKMSCRFCNYSGTVHCP